MNLERIKYVREENELTQREMAEILKVKRSAYSLWEINRNIIPLIKLNDFGNYFSLSLDYLVGLINNRKIVISKVELDKKRIGGRIRVVRKELNLTQEKLAKKFNTTHSVISAYEAGKTLIPTIFLVEFAKISNVSLDWFCGRSDKKYLK